jgi:DNA replication and repair protein RecF
MITKFWLKYFRNITEITVDLKENKHCYIFGDNNQGKTSILEAIFVASKQKTLGDNQISELIQNSQAGAYIGLQIEKDIKQRLYVKCDRTGKVVSTLDNKKENKKQAKNRNMEYISADAIHIFQKEPLFRRKILDQFCIKLTYGYEEKLRSYEKLLRQKNKYLKAEKVDENLILTLNIQLARLAKEIVSTRLKAISLIEKELNKKTTLKDRLFVEIVSINYKINRLAVDDMCVYEDVLLKTMEEDKQKERILGYSLSGPQRDDFEILLEEKSIFSYYSRGINRCYAILFRLAQIQILTEQNSYTCLLLDDTFAEIDQVNKKYLLKEISSRYQVFYATTSRNDFDFFNETCLINIKNGKIEYV